LALAPLEIQRDAALARVEIGEGEAELDMGFVIKERAVPTNAGSGERLDENDVGAKIGELLAAVLAGQSRQIQDLDSCQSRARRP
jgi:hypothetical protein